MLKGIAIPPRIPLSTQYYSHQLGALAGESIHQWYKCVDMMKLMEEVYMDEGNTWTKLEM